MLLTRSDNLHIYEHGVKLIYGKGWKYHVRKSLVNPSPRGLRVASTASSAEGSIFMDPIPKHGGSFGDSVFSASIERSSMLSQSPTSVIQNKRKLGSARVPKLSRVLSTPSRKTRGGGRVRRTNEKHCYFTRAR